MRPWGEECHRGTQLVTSYSGKDRFYSVTTVGERAELHLDLLRGTGPFKGRVSVRGMGLMSELGKCKVTKSGKRKCVSM